jgi:hypothetical protein
MEGINKQVATRLNQWVDTCNFRNKTHLLFCRGQPIPNTPAPVTVKWQVSVGRWGANTTSRVLTDTWSVGWWGSGTVWAVRQSWRRVVTMFAHARPNAATGRCLVSSFFPLQATSVTYNIKHNNNNDFPWNYEIQEVTKDISLQTNTFL